MCIRWLIDWNKSLFVAIPCGESFGLMKLTLFVSRVSFFCFCSLCSPLQVLVLFCSFRVLLAWLCLLCCIILLHSVHCDCLVHIIAWNDNMRCNMIGMIVFVHCNWALRAGGGETARRVSRKFSAQRTTSFPQTAFQSRCRQRV